MARPSGTVTFLFTDIEGSTRRWQADAEAMRAALALHDDLLRSAIEAHQGWLFKHTGDGVCAAFSSAGAAVDAAVQAQQSLGLPVRMGIATGDAECQGDDYFGPVLNRTARIAAAGHGGQIVVAASTAALLSGVELVDLGEHRLRDLSSVERLHQVCAAGLRAGFPPLRTPDVVPCNLPLQATSFVGRDVAVKELGNQLRTVRLVTLTGVGGVGKTRLALSVAAELIGEFPDGVWLVELGPVADPAAVPDALAAVLGVTSHPGLSLIDSIAQALTGRRTLLVLDNCEHVLDAAAEAVQAILARTDAVAVMATSREGLRIDGEHLWLVPSLDVGTGARSAAVELFVDRARAVVADFGLSDDDDAAAVVEICRRLDGIALGIELAAARTVSMTPGEIVDRLADRFRLLSGSRRGLERHQTLRQAVGWSYGLLGDDDAAVLRCLSVFSGGFDLAAAAYVCGRPDEYTVLDVLDSLVRKSLVMAERTYGHTRYRMLETVRQFAEEQLGADGTSDDVRDRHAVYFAREAVARWDMWEGPGYRRAVDWVDVEFANLRAGFRWAADRGDVASAAAIAAHTTMMAWSLQLFEPTRWAEEMLPAAVATNLPQTPRLYSAASLCFYVGRVDEAVAYAQAAVALQDAPGYDPFDPGWSRSWAATVLMAGGDLEAQKTYTELSSQPGLARVAGLGMRLFVLSFSGAEEARAIAGEAISVARVHGNPMWTAWALIGAGRAFADTDHERALDMFREALALAQDERIPYWEARVTYEVARIEIVHGDRGKALELFDSAIEAHHRTGNEADLAIVLATLVTFFDRDQQPAVAAIIYGAAIRQPGAMNDFDLPAVLDHVRAALGGDVFEQLVAEGAAMTFADAVRYSRDQIRLARLNP